MIAFRVVRFAPMIFIVTSIVFVAIVCFNWQSSGYEVNNFKHVFCSIFVYLSHT